MQTVALHCMQRLQRCNETAWHAERVRRSVTLAAYIRYAANGLGGRIYSRPILLPAEAGRCRGISALKSPRLTHRVRLSRSTSATAIVPHSLACAIISPL